MMENKGNFRKHQYDILIVLCPGNPLKNCRFSEIEYNAIYDAKTYAGGEVRMRAAVKASENADWIIVVGGSERKVSCMKDYILKRVNAVENKRLKQHIIRVESNPDTNGNIHAIKKALDGIRNWEKRIVFLTSSFHMPRVKLFTKDILKTSLRQAQFLEAENIVKGPALANLSKEKSLREKLEKQGLQDWQNGNYVNQHASEEDFDCIVYDIIPYLNLREADQNR